MGRLGVAIKAAAVIAVTLGATIPAVVARWLSLGSPRVHAFWGSRACSAWGRVLCAILGVRRIVRGAPPTGGVFLVAANHLSYLDILVLASLYPSLFVAKREIASWPLFGWITRNAGTLFVDRERPRDVVRAGALMTAHLSHGVSLTLFPEGMATSGKRVEPFLPSLLEPAARVGVPCYAVTLGYETPGCAEPPARTVCWARGEPFVGHFLRLLELRRIEARISFAAQPLVESDRKELARRLHERVEESFVPVRQDEAGAQDYSRGVSHTSAPAKSQGSRPSSQSAGSGEKVTSVK